MTAIAKLEARIATLEAEVAALKSKVNKDEIPWTEKIVGTFANDPIYDEAMRLGRAWRDSTRPKARKRKPSRRATQT